MIDGATCGSVIVSTSVCESVPLPLVAEIETFVGEAPILTDDHAPADQLLTRFG